MVWKTLPQGDNLHLHPTEGPDCALITPSPTNME